MDFWISNWISGFHSGFLDFWISAWISGFHSGFLYFSLDFCISVWISVFQFGFLPTVYEISFVTDPSVSTPPCTSVRGTGYVFMTAVHGGSPREVPRYERHVEAIINQWTIMSVWGLREEYLPQRELNWTKLQVGQLERKWVWVEP